MNMSKPGKYRGQDDLERFDDWVSQLLKYSGYLKSPDLPRRRTESFIPDCFQRD
jgi:hypothetical protein